ncbi:MAG TPA: hypothetical protein VFW87_10240 [Pirellulales bacterium]|nr:hypothetical protein [Pirellulales bacterium]
MQRLQLLLALLADQHAIRNIARGMQSRQAQVDVGDLTSALLIFCLFFVSVWGISRLVARKERAVSCLDPRALFRALCRAHQLNRPDRQLLKQLALEHRLAQPSLLFIEPDCFDVEELGEAWQKHRQRLTELRTRLFAGLGQRADSKRQAEAETVSA